MQTIQIQDAEGGSVRVSLRGGQICGWQTPDGTERLYLSPRADFSGATAIRGGVPVIFPQFGNQGPLQKHGFARLAEWQLVASGIDGTGAGHAVLSLDHGAGVAFAHPCRLAMTVRFAGRWLEMTLAVENSGNAAFRFTAALHTYLAAQRADAAVHGLAGLAYSDSAREGHEDVADPTPLRFDREIDRIFRAVAGPIELRQPGSIVRSTQIGFEDAVVWNPGDVLGPRLADLPADGYQHFVCLEAALIARPHLLAAGARWTGRQRLEALA